MTQAGHRVARFPCTHVLALQTLLRKETPFSFFRSFGPLAAAGVTVTGLTHPTRTDTPNPKPRAADERVLDAKPVSPDAFLLSVFALGPLAAAVVRVAEMGRDCARVAEADWAT